MEYKYKYQNQVSGINNKKCGPKKVYMNLKTQLQRLFVLIILRNKFNVIVNVKIRKCESKILGM